MQARRSFTLRFEHQETRDLLSLVSGRLGVSMNQLAEQMDPIRDRMVGGNEDPFGVASAFVAGAHG